MRQEQFRKYYIFLKSNIHISKLKLLQSIQINMIL